MEATQTPSFGALADDDVAPFGQLAPRFTNFRRSNNIDDRRQESLWAKYGPQSLFSDAPSLDEIKLMLQHPLTPFQRNPMPPVDALSVDAGINDIDPALSKLRAAASSTYPQIAPSGISAQIPVPFGSLAPSGQ